MAENAYKEACNVYSSCSEDVSKDYEEACTVSPSRVSAARIRRALGLNPATGTSALSGEPGSSGSQSNDKHQATDPGPASAEIAGYIPEVGMSSPGRSQIWTSAMLKTYAVVTMVLICCLLGVTIFLAVTVSNLKLSFHKLKQETADDLSGLKLSVSQLDKKTANDLADLKLSVSQLDKKTAGIQTNVSGWMQRQQAMGKDVLERLVENEKALQLTQSELDKEKILQRLEKLEGNITIEHDEPEKERAPINLPAKCPDGYKKYREACYKAFDTQKSFSESAEACRGDGGTLAMPRDAGINDFLVSMMNPTNYKPGDYWFGLRREKEKWEWIDGTALGTGYNRWATGDPDRFVGYCAVYLGKWWFGSDCDHRRGSICQVLPSAPGK